MGKSKFLAVVVSFNPDVNRLERLLSIVLKQVDEVFIYDNNSENRTTVSELGAKLGLQVVLFNENHGLSISYNHAIHYAVKKGFSHLLLLDQDSIPADHFVEKLYKGFDQNDKIAVVVPSIVDEKSGHSTSPKQEFQIVQNLINSGSLFRVDILSSLNGYDERLFIDYADYEISYRLRKNNYLILRSRDAKLLHVLGDGTVKRFLGVNFYVTNHSISRRYLISKNRIIVYKKYFFSFPLEVLRDIGSMFKLLISVFLFEANKWQKCAAIFRGIYAGFVTS
jgi:rhamnosyltransferase